MVSIADEGEAEFVIDLVKTQYSSQSWVGLEVDPVTSKLLFYN
jgi:hypothetical protein